MVTSPKEAGTRSAPGRVFNRSLSQLGADAMLKSATLVDGAAPDNTPAHPRCAIQYPPQVVEPDQPLQVPRPVAYDSLPDPTA